MFSFGRITVAALTLRPALALRLVLNSYFIFPHDCNNGLKRLDLIAIGVLFIFELFVRVDNNKERNNHNLELSSFSQLFLLRIESLSHNLVPGGLGLSQLESVEVIESSSLGLQLQPLGPA